MKTNKLTDAALDWAVMQCRGLVWSLHGRVPSSTDWSQGGPIIEREKITIEWTGEDWMGYIRHDDEVFGPTPLIAAMRCFVSSRLGDDIEIPSEIIEGI